MRPGHWECNQDTNETFQLSFPGNTSASSALQRLISRQHIILLLILTHIVSDARYFTFACNQHLCELLTACAATIGYLFIVLQQLGIYLLRYNNWVFIELQHLDIY